MRISWKIMNQVKNISHQWTPFHMIDNTNAIVLEISKHKGCPKHIVPEGGYVDEKIDSLNNK